MVFGADAVTTEQLPAKYLEPRRSRDGEPRALDPDQPVLPLREFKARSEKRSLEEVLARRRGNVSAAARLLGTQRTYLHQKMTALGCSSPSSSTSPPSNSSFTPLTRQGRFTPQICTYSSVSRPRRDY